MAKIFEVRGTQFKAWHSRFAGGASLCGATAPTLVNDGTFVGSYIARSSTTLKGLMYPGYLNTPATASFTAHFTFIPRYTGFPAAIQSFWGMGGPGTASPFNIELSHLTNGTIRFRMHTGTGAATNYVTTATVSPTSGTKMVLTFVVNGVAETLACSVDGVQIHTGTITSSHAAFNDQKLRPLIYFGFGIGGANAIWDLINFELYDSVEAHVFTPATAYDATVGYEGFPLESDVKLSVTYGGLDAELTGTYAPSTTLTAAEIADAVWDAALTDHTTVDSFGAWVKKLLKTATFRGEK